MSEQKSSYRDIMKATSIFGGVQVLQIIIGIIRSKFIAVLLGPAGMGIAGLLNSTVGLIASLTNFGLGTSAVKDIAAASSCGDIDRLRVVSTVFKRWVWVTGLIGAVLTAVLSPWLSEITFGNRNYTYAFIFISITLLLNQISSGQGVMLRGMRKISYMAQSALIGSIIGLFTTIPLYYIYGIEGIVPGIIITSVTTLLLTWYFANKLKVRDVHVTLAQTITEGKGMLKMGFLISLSTLIAAAASYVVRIYIGNSGGINEVGLYNAGFTIINTYVGMIFTAMAADYYPRLASVGQNNSKMQEVVNQQSEIAILILAPILLIFLVFINWVVILLYSTEFLGITTMIYWAALGMFFKAASWAVGFIFVAKGNSKLFFWNELVANIYLLILNIAGYYYMGLEGLGVSFLIGYSIYLIQVYFITNRKFKFLFHLGFIKIFVFQVGLALLSFLAVKFFISIYAYSIGVLLILISATYSWNELDKRMDLRSTLRNLQNKFKK